MIKHVVMWKFHDQAEGKSREENMAFIRAKLTALKPVISQLLSMEIGSDTGVGRDTYDMVLITTFENTDALEAYQQHPEHKKVSEYVAKVRKARACVDFHI